MALLKTLIGNLIRTGVLVGFKPGEQGPEMVPVWLKMNMGFPGGSVIKNPPAFQKTRVRSLGWEDPLEEEMPTHSSILV